jgi:hypothetical protein
MAPILFIYAALCEQPYNCGITAAVFDRRLHSGPRVYPGAPNRRAGAPLRRRRPYTLSAPPPPVWRHRPKKVGRLHKRGGAGGPKLAESSQLASSPPREGP